MPKKLRKEKNPHETSLIRGNLKQGRKLVKLKKREENETYFT